MTDVPNRGGPTSAQLKADIDSGRTGDKVAFPDPGLSPLGTDDEAAGAGPTAMQIATARAQETTRPIENNPRPASKAPWVVVGIVVLCALIFAAAWFGRGM